MDLAIDILFHVSLGFMGIYTGALTAAICDFVRRERLDK